MGKLRSACRRFRSSNARDNPAVYPTAGLWERSCLDRQEIQATTFRLKTTPPNVPIVLASPRVNALLIAASSPSIMMCLVIFRGICTEFTVSLDNK